MPTEYGKWIDVTCRCSTGMVHWPGNPPVRIACQLDRARGDTCNVSALSFGAHTGTHVDAPVHCIDGGKGVDTLDTAAGVGLARVVNVAGGGSVTAGVVAGARPAAGRAGLVQGGQLRRGVVARGLRRGSHLPGRRSLPGPGPRRGDPGRDRLSLGRRVPLRQGRRRPSPPCWRPGHGSWKAWTSAPSPLVPTNCCTCRCD